MSFFNRFHDGCDNDSAYESWFCLLLIDKCINVDVTFFDVAIL